MSLYCVGATSRSRQLGGLDPRSMGLNREDTVASAAPLDADTAFIGEFCVFHKL